VVRAFNPAARNQGCEIKGRGHRCAVRSWQEIGRRPNPLAPVLRGGPDDNGRPRARKTAGRCHGPVRAPDLPRNGASFDIARKDMRKPVSVQVLRTIAWVLSAEWRDTLLPWPPISRAVSAGVNPCCRCASHQRDTGIKTGQGRNQRRKGQFCTASVAPALGQTAGQQGACKKTLGHEERIDQKRGRRPSSGNASQRCLGRPVSAPRTPPALADRCGRLHSGQALPNNLVAGRDRWWRHAPRSPRHGRAPAWVMPRTVSLPGSAFAFRQCWRSSSLSNPAQRTDPDPGRRNFSAFDVSVQVRPWR